MDNTENKVGLGFVSEIAITAFHDRTWITEMILTIFY